MLYFRNSLLINKTLANKLIVLLSIFLLASGVALSASFNTTVSSNNVTVGEQIQITFKVDRSRVSNFKPPTFKGFTVLMGPSQSSFTQIINGQVSQSFSYIYLLRAEAVGTFEIPPAQITVEGEVLRSNPVKITVKQGSQRQQQQQAQSHSQQSQGQQSQQDNEKALSKEANELISKHLFVRLNVNKNTAYKGEPVYATYRLYINPELNVLNAAAPKQPMFNGFWSQEFKLDQIQYSGTENINGINYRYADIAKVLLIPQQTGMLTIEPFEMEFVVRLRVQNQRKRQRDPWGFDDFFDDPFFGGANYRDFKYVGKSATGKVSVLPLPEPIPVDFSNGVGSYKFSASIDKTKMKTNEPFTVKYKVEGTGNLKLVQNPILALPNDLEQFEPKFTENINYSAAGMSGSKVFEYVIIPRAPGKFTVPSVTFVYFDYQQKRYFTINSEEFTVEVEKGVFTDYNSQSITANTDIKGIKHNTNFANRGAHFLNSPLFWVLTLLPVLAFLFIFLLKKKQEDDRNNIAEIKNKNAGKYAKKRFTQASKLLAAGNVPAFYEELHRSILEYFANKFKLSASELNKEVIAQRIIAIANEDMANTSNQILEMCERARFTPDGGSVNAGEILNQSELLVAEMERVK